MDKQAKIDKFNKEIQKVIDSLCDMGYSQKEAEDYVYSIFADDDDED